MRVSTKGRYGLRCMVDLAINSNGEQVSIKSIAERQDISENYLEQVFSALRKAEIVKSIKGSQGGYMIAAGANNIKVGDIIRALEGKIEVAEGSEDQSGFSSSFDRVLTTFVWNRLNAKINNIIDSITLEDLIEEVKRINGETEYMYHI